MKSGETAVNRRLFGDASWALLGQLASGVALLLGTRIITELVSPEIYGQVALLGGFVALGVALFAYPFVFAGMRLLPECLHKRERAELQRAVSGLTTRSTALAMVVLAVGGAAYAYAASVDPWLIVLACLLLATTVRRELGVQMLIGERRQRDASLWQTSDSILRPLLAIALVWLGGAKAVWVMLGYALASLAVNIVWAMVHRSPSEEKHHQAVPASLKREVWAYALPLIPMELLFWINGLGDRYVIGYLMTAAQVGIYTAAYTLTNEAFNRSAMILLRTFQPVYFQYVSTGQESEAYKILWVWLCWVLAMGLWGVLALWMLKDWVASLLLAKAFHSAVDLMPCIGIGCALQALATVLSQPLLAAKRTRALLLGRLFGVVTAAISIPLMVKGYGLPGAALANPLYFGVEALAMAVLAKPWRMMEPAHDPGLAIEGAAGGDVSR
ncbi:MAG: lipopolysaccharide biosynthesis protein [Methylococcaceae bacterium]|nr:lipopolysaccharide biosynthesis protein [Methylococcaceae bacterium]